MVMVLIGLCNCDDKGSLYMLHILR